MQNCGKCAGWINVYHLVCRTTLSTDYLKHIPLPGFPAMEGQCCGDAEAPCWMSPGISYFFPFEWKPESIKMEKCFFDSLLEESELICFFFFFYLFCNLIWNRQTKPTLTERAFMFISHMPYFLCISLWRSHLIFRIFIFFFYLSSVNSEASCWGQVVADDVFIWKRGWRRGHSRNESFRYKFAEFMSWGWVVEFLTISSNTEDISF